VFRALSSIMGLHALLFSAHTGTVPTRECEGPRPPALHAIMLGIMRQRARAGGGTVPGRSYLLPG
jgi:hypothetical protein